MQRQHISMPLKLHSYAAKEALQYLLNMVDKPAKLLDYAVVNGQTGHFCMCSGEHTNLLKTTLKYQSVSGFHETGSKTQCLSARFEIIHCF
uniref:Uncharacterized protein n=1 Tax=Rhipicephalus zambeziensis TaxID=60191 RepID=A0A224YHB7_9ACAR